MKKILITGSSGHIGSAIFKQQHLFVNDILIATSRQPLSKQDDSHAENKKQQRVFDFENKETWASAFEGIDVLFLLRPPQLG